MSLAVGILDQSPVVAGATPADAVAATIALARDADRLGYARYWVAEHHAMRGLADPAPEILVARLAAETSRIRVGTGGVLLPHYSALKIAEQFRMLETLSPGRIDLGIGRAPGGLPMVSHALGSRDVSTFPAQVQELIAFLDDTLPESHPYASLYAMPSGMSTPEVWMLGSSEYGASLAAQLGMPYCFAHFISGDAPQVTRAYRRHFRPSARTPEPRLMLALSAIAADTMDEAAEYAAAIGLWRLRVRRGIDLTVPSVADAHAYPYTEYDRHELAQSSRRLAVGTAQGVRERIEAAAAMHEADEAMIVSIAPTFAARSRSYALIAEAFGLTAHAEGAAAIR